MKHLIIITMIFAAILCHSENICMTNYSKNASEALFSEFVETLRENCKDSINLENLQIDSDHYSFNSEEVTHKIKRKSPVIGMLPEIPKAKWKTQKIKIKGHISDAEICLDFNSSAYNRKDKKWYPVKAPFYIKDVVQTISLKSIIGKKVWSIGNPVVFIDDINNTKPKNLTAFNVEDASITFGSIRGVAITLNHNNSPVIFRIPFVGDILNTLQAIDYFNSKFIDFNPKTKVNRDYDYYWEVARHGDIMDGMHTLQLITAIGYPLKKDTIKQGHEKWTYNLNGKSYTFDIENNVLTISEDFTW